MDLSQGGIDLSQLFFLPKNAQHMRKNYYVLMNNLLNRKFLEE